MQIPGTQLACTPRLGQGCSTTLGLFRHQTGQASCPGLSPESHKTLDELSRLRIRQGRSAWPSCQALQTTQQSSLLPPISPQIPTSWPNFAKQLTSRFLLRTRTGQGCSTGARPSCRALSDWASLLLGPDAHTLSKKQYCYAKCCSFIPNSGCARRPRTGQGCSTSAWPS